jgi:hypothetical protein
MFETTKEKVLFFVLILLAVVLVASNVFTIYYLMHKDDVKKVPTIVKNVEPEKTEVKVEEEVEPEDLMADEEEDLEIDVKTDLKTGELKVSWFEFPKVINSLALIPYDAFNRDQDKRQEASEFMHVVSHVGAVEAGEYAGSPMYLVQVSPEGMAFSDDYLWVVKANNQLIVLQKYSDMTSWPLLNDIFTYNKNLTLFGWDAPETISIPGSKYVLKKGNMQYTKMISSYQKLEKLFKYDGDNYVYWDALYGCFVIKRAGDTAQEYYLDTDFFGSDRSSSYSGSLSEALDFKWLDGSQNEDEYQTSRLTGCGSHGCYSYPDNLKESQLVKVGTTPSDGDVYAFDLNIKESQLEKKGHQLQLAYDSYYPGYDEVAKKTKDKMAFESFVQGHPLLYWKDPFGRWIQFLAIKYQPAVECGKPVIYLYPENDMQVDVKVEPAGGIKISDPNYGDGWSVIASTQSELYNFTDMITYPYLFWEGYGYNYAQPEKGFVVEASDVENFLEYSLSGLGLNEKEIKDFNEFWVPRMNEKPYYFITYLPKSEFDKIAPLTVTPEPDTVIRVFMDYQGLDEFKYVEPLNLVAPERKGFTVVEWGGALHE